MAKHLQRIAFGLLALVAILLAIAMLERPRAALESTHMTIGTTPATLIQRAGSTGPVVVVAHGFAGSRQIMQAYSLALAQSGYRVLAFDFQGHGRNPTPMSGDVGSIEGTTALLVAETRAVMAAARALPGDTGLALLGHSMATDILVRASLAETELGRPVDAIVAVSMYSQAVTADHPKRLLVISGAWETFLREAAMEAVHLVDPQAGEGDLARNGAVLRRAVAAPYVEHVGVLFSPTAVEAAQGWLDQTFGRPASPPASPMGLWILVLLGGIVLALAPLAQLLPRAPAPPPLSTKRVLLATLLPALLTPVLITPFYRNFMPVLVADYLMLHLALFGALQLAMIGGWQKRHLALHPAAIALLALWGIVVFGLALDRYAASFWPTAERLPIIAALSLGTIPFMLADSLITGAGRAPVWQRIWARLLVFVSLGIAAAIDPEQLTFVLIILPVFVLFYLVHGLMGRWVARQSGPVAAGLGLGLCLAWALGVSFPLFV